MLLKAWEAAASSYWLPPSAMAAAGILLAVGMLALDASGVEAIRDFLPWVYRGGAEGAREILGSVASSMMTVLSVSFSVTIVALTVASQQFGPRVLHNFIRKPGPQVVLGSFIGTFLYSLIVLRSVRGEGEEQFVPHLSVSLGVVMAGLSIAALIYFIHHVSASIQASTILAEIAAELESGIERLFPDELARGQPDGAGAGDDEAEWAEASGGMAGEAVASASSGYVQGVDEGSVMRVATACDVVIRVECRPGDFVIGGQKLATVAPAGRVERGDLRRLRSAFLVGPRRTPSQDVTFGLGQLLEISLHALSPAVNEPFLANNCNDRLVQALCRLAERGIPSPRRLDEHGRVRVVARPLTFVTAASHVFDSLLPAVGSNTGAATRLLDGIGWIAPYLRREEDRAALERHALQLHAEARRAAPGEGLKRRVDEAYGAASFALRTAVIASPRTAG